jgi:O-antigen/teichoic acid export membrane protein
LLTGAWVVGTLEGAHLEAERIRSSVTAFYKGIFLVAFPLAFAGTALLAPVIRVYTSGRLPPAEQIAPLMLLFFTAALLATPWGLVVRVRELAWLNAVITIAQLGFAALADFWLIQSYGLWGAVAAVGLTTALTLVLTFVAWRRFDRTTLSIPWSYAARSALAASPYLLLLPFTFTRLPTRYLVPVAILATALTTLGWAYLIRRLGLLSEHEVPLLHQSRHGPVKLALRYLAPNDR